MILQGKILQFLHPVGYKTTLTPLSLQTLNLQAVLTPQCLFPVQFRLGLLHS